jgi:protein involved in sex pheromone biosynthesis
MMLSGCGVAKNLEKPGLSEIAKPKFDGDAYVPAEGQFWAEYSEGILEISMMGRGSGFTSNM